MNISGLNCWSNCRTLIFSTACRKLMGGQTIHCRVQFVSPAALGSFVKENKQNHHYTFIFWRMFCQPNGCLQCSANFRIIGTRRNPYCSNVPPRLGMRTTLVLLRFFVVQHVWLYPALLWGLRLILNVKLASGWKFLWCFFFPGMKKQTPHYSEKPVADKKKSWQKTKILFQNSCPPGSMPNFLRLAALFLDTTLSRCTLYASWLNNDVSHDSWAGLANLWLTWLWRSFLCVVYT